MNDALKISNVLQTNNQGTYADETRSALYLERTKNFPLNSEFETTLTFVNKSGKSGRYVNDVTPTSEAISLRIHHSFVQLPDDQFETRLYDARSPYITNSYLITVLLYQSLFKKTLLFAIV
jgi:hypothetical protein